MSWLDFVGFFVDFDLVHRYGARFLDGVVVTIQLVTISFLFGMILGMAIALARLSHNSTVAALSYAYVYFFRGTPLLAQLFLLYYGAGQFRDSLDAVGLWWLFREAWNCALLAFILNTAAYLAEIFRGGIQSVPRGQREAAASLGLHPRIAFIKIVLPQALIIALRPLGNELVLLIKASAVASLVTIYDLMGATKVAFARSYDFQLYLWAALAYLILVEIIRRVWVMLEVKLTRHLRPA